MKPCVPLMGIWIVDKQLTCEKSFSSPFLSILPDISDLTERFHEYLRGVDLRDETI
jgi:hypothetical protein